MKKKNTCSKGFTLIELLVVIAIIGILAGVVLVSLNAQRGRARLSSALQSASSAMPYVTDCVLRGKQISVAANNVEICAGAVATWPALGTASTQGCSWSSTNNTSDSTNVYYYAYCSDSGKYVYCNVNAPPAWWGNDFQQGTCIAQ